MTIFRYANKSYSQGAITQIKTPNNKSSKTESSKATFVYKHSNLSLLFMQNTGIIFELYFFLNAAKLKNQYFYTFKVDEALNMKT